MIRKLKVYLQGDPWKKTEQPQIRFGGRWLRDAGFEPGRTYRITIHTPGLLTITLDDPDAPRGPRAP